LQRFSRSRWFVAEVLSAGSLEFTSWVLWIVEGFVVVPYVLLVCYCVHSSCDLMPCFLKENGTALH
jgi:hypothetical protein